MSQRGRRSVGGRTCSDPPAVTERDDFITSPTPPSSSELMAIALNPGRFFIASCRDRGDGREGLMFHTKAMGPPSHLVRQSDHPQLKTGNGQPTILSLPFSRGQLHRVGFQRNRALAFAPSLLQVLIPCYQRGPGHNVAVPGPCYRHHRR